MPNAIIVKQLKKKYKTHKRKQGLAAAIKSLIKREYVVKDALKGISFNVKKGEILGFIGPNGAGKSTTIKALSGVLYPTSGKVNVLGFTPWKERVKYVKNIGVVFGQKPQLQWDLPPIDSFYLNKVLYEIPEKTFKKRLKYMVELMDVREVIYKPVRDLSLGERMKCKLIASLLHNPKLVFLDEPSIGLDAIAKERFRMLIEESNRRDGTTFIVTTHDMQDIERLCKRVIIINYGDIIYDGNLNNIKQKFITTKVLDVKLEESGPKFKFPACKVLHQDDFEIKIEVDTKKQKLRQVIDHLIDKYSFADLIISDPPIEEIIAKIYTKKKC